ncbi:HAD family hydrolase [Alteromonas sp. CYL-A6]|uniref:HAD family hydrolase n=1 Tax=Alteromonas nitratireducens TaxID=3390813 RepID=UPI0034AF95FD
MDLIFFDLDGTLLNRQSELSIYTRETLTLLRENGIAYTVATGRTMQSAQRLISGHFFDLPNIYNNGVTVWNPRDNALRLSNLLSSSEVSFILESARERGLAPFVNTVTTGAGQHQHVVFHGQARHAIEKELIHAYFSRHDLSLVASLKIPATSSVTNISMIGEKDTIKQVYDIMIQAPGLIAYSGPAVEGDRYSWIDIHHERANKGSAVASLKNELGATNVICFGDSDNDISMFKLADECYAPENARDDIKQIASEVIGHHDEDGVARFLRARFGL